MPDITQLVPKKTVTPSPQRLPVRAIITTPPVSIDAPTMRIVVPSYTTDYDNECRWDRQSDTLPNAGADCLVVWDETGAGVVVWFAAGPVPVDVTIKDHVTFPGGTPFATLTVTHGLGLMLPYGALVSANEQTGTGEMIAYTRAHASDDLLVVIKDGSGSPTVDTTCAFTLRITQ